MVKIFRGSGINFSNIILSRRFHPPLRRNPRLTVVGEYDYTKDLITIFLPGLKKTGCSQDIPVTHREVERIIVHESLHGVIHSICKKDKIDIYDYDEHIVIDKLE